MDKDTEKEHGVKYLEKFPPNKVGEVLMKIIITLTFLFLIIYGMMKYDLFGSFRMF